MPLILLLLACGGPPPDPELAALGAAVQASREGEAALAAGAHDAARQAFARALEARPQDALLHAWAGRAAAEAGELAAALASLDQALRLAPDFGEAALLRARLRARAGDEAGAADDVLRALRLGVVTPRGVLRDADLAPLRATPELSFLPAAPLEARLRVPAGVAYWGSEVDVTLDVVGAVEGPLTVTGPAHGPAGLARVVEEDAVGDEGDRVRTVRWTFRVDGPGGIAVGPLEVAQGGVSARAEAVTLPTDAPPGREAAPRPLPLTTAAAVLGDRVPPAAWRADGGVWVAVPPGGHVRVTPPAPIPVPWTLARDGEVVAELVRLEGPVERVTVRQDAAVLLDGAPQD